MNVPSNDGEHHSMNQSLGPRPQVDGDSPKRILYDMSFTCLSGKISGIERVVHSLVTAGMALQRANAHHPSSLAFIPVFASEGRFYELDERARSLLAPSVEFERDCISSSPHWYRLIASMLCRTVPVPWLRRQLLPPAGHLGIFKTWHRRWKKNSLAVIAVGQTPIELCADDIVWLPDAYWAQPSVWLAAEHARQRGALVASLVYDLIPLRSDTINQGFRDYLRQLLDKSHVALCISDCERRQLEAFQASYTPKSSSCSNFRTITLGCDIPHSHGKVRWQFAVPFESPSKISSTGIDALPYSSDGGASGHIRSKVSSTGIDALPCSSGGGALGHNGSKHPTAGIDVAPVYLCVNTFDPRKNHALLLDAFDQLWAKGNDVRLCLVGRVGWKCHEILRRISDHNELNQRLFVFHDATDAEINYCYQRARAVITTSKDEGFGLPIVESLSRGRTTLASDIPIHREVGGHSCHYFASTDPAELALLVQQCESSQLPRADSNGPMVANRPKIQSWQQSFAQCRQELVDAFGQRRSHRAAA
ncbi:MAG: glycosyltransferase [Planctomycetales bacterium]|nr:glycosyltransferase [Planctomycetales bacterium]